MIRRNDRAGFLIPFRLALIVVGLVGGGAGADEIPVDLSGYRPESGILIRRDGDRLTVDWPINDAEHGRMVLDLKVGSPLIENLGIAPAASAQAATILKGAEPVTFVTVGTREAPSGRPPGMSVFNTFFDSPAVREHHSYRARLNLRRVRATSQARRATIALGDLTAGPFAGELQLTVYAGAPLVHVEAVVSTKEDRRAFLYDAGLLDAAPGGRRIAAIDTEGLVQREEVGPDADDRAVAVRRRAIVVEADSGSIAAFPPPHQFFFPRDLTDNLETVWFGRNHRGLGDRFGFGVRQSETGGGNFVPWFNAPAGTEQRLGVFYLLSRGKAEDVLREVDRYTHGDRLPDLPGHVTFTSHWHMATAVAAIKEQAQGIPRTTPDFTRMFKEMNVDIVHLAEFHGDGHPNDAGPLRVPELEAMFAECRRLSDAELLILPGEEANVYLGRPDPVVNTGHWLYLFPKPVYWTMRRASDQPFAEADSRLGTVYHVGDRDDMFQLLEREHGLAWTAHARIKASSWAPDIYRDEEFYRSESWLGAAWKAMPADFSRPKLGERGLDLLDDMANWGQQKYLLGEVDVFKVDHTHELYGHMNINYVRLDRLPRFDEGWRPLLDALRAGRFFVTTGEVILRDFHVADKQSGESLKLDGGDRPEVRLDLEWTFPLRFAEVVSGDGQHVFRERIDLSDTAPFGRRTLAVPIDLRDRKWVRVEVWDVAADGAFSQPVWLEPGAGAKIP